MLTLRLIRREARTGWPVAVVLALLAVLLTALPLSWPPQFDRMAADTLAARLERAGQSGPLLAVRSSSEAITDYETQGPAAVGRGTLDEALNEIGDGLRGAAAQPLAGLLGTAPGRAVTTSAAAEGPGVPTFHGLPPLLTLAYAQPGAGSPVEYVRGRAPSRPAADPVTVGAVGSAAPVEPVEVAVSEGGQADLGLTVGQRFELKGEGWATPVVLVGVFRTDRGADRLWQQYPLLVRPATVHSLLGRQLNGQLLTSSGGIEQVESRGRVPLTLDWDLAVTVDRSARTATPTGLTGLRKALTELRAVEAGRLCTAVTGGGACRSDGHLIAKPELIDRLTPELDAFALQRARTEQLQGFALAGLLTVVVATAVAAARLGIRRRSAAFGLQLTRGASLSGIAGRLLAEAALPVGLGVAVGWALAGALLPPGATPGPAGPVLVAALLIWCAPAAVLLATVGRSGSLPRSRRLVLEALVLLAAVGGLAALRSRGAFGGDGVDLQLALVPVLLALAMVVALVRALPPLLLRGTRWARRSTGLVPLVALARAGAQSGAAALALLVLVLATGSGVFGGMVARTLDDSRAQTAAWRTGGAPAALVGPRDRLPDELVHLPTVDRRVLVTAASGELTSQESGATVPAAELVALDAVALRAAAPASPLAAALRAAQGTAQGAGLETGQGTGKGTGQGTAQGVAREAGGGAAGGSSTGSVGGVGAGTVAGGSGGPSGAAVVWSVLADPGLARAYPDGVFEVAAFGTTNFRVQVVGALPAEALRDPALGPVLGSGPSPSAVLVFTDPSAERQLPVSGGHPSALLLHPAVGGPPMSTSAVRAAAAGALAPAGVAGPAVELRDRDEESGALREDGLVRSLGLAFRLTTGAGLLLALGAVALELVLGSAERARTTSYLRTLGLGGGALTALQLLQLLPLFLASVIGGTALGLLLPAALGPGLDLRALTGGPFEPAVRADWTVTVGLGAALAALLLAAAALEAANLRRRGLGTVLRLGEAL
ncbi:hypothetical protein ACIRBX_01190 [Kitasatospora sp. NPDC096147]|uniref:hypothetical protein n=1 Tax=Kitasatospora sp. NPDC096147 TaxID=3364093 RepID=UPI00380A11F1